MNMPSTSRHCSLVLAAITSLVVASCGSENGSSNDQRSSEDAEVLPTVPLFSSPPDVLTTTSQPDIDVPRVVGMDELAAVGANPPRERTTLVLDFDRDSPTWWATAWTSDPASADADVYCIGTPSGVSCRGDGQELDRSVEVLYSDSSGIVFLAEPEVNSLLAQSGETTIKLSLAPLDVRSRRGVAAMSRTLDDDGQFVVDAFDDLGGVIETVQFSAPSEPTPRLVEPPPGENVSEREQSLQLANLLPHAPVELTEG